MPAGRPRKSGALRLVEGNRGNRPIPPEVQFDSELPECPDYLDGIARAQWDRLATKLHGAGLLTSVDADALAAYCVSYAEWRQCIAVVKLKGPSSETLKGGCMIRPEVKIAHKALQNMQQLMAQFGLSPKARANLGAVGKPAEDDPFAEAMKGAG